MTGQDLHADVSLSNLQNFSIAFQYGVNTYQPLKDFKQYNYYVNLIYNCTELVVQNIESNGFGNSKIIDGKNVDYTDAHYNENRYSFLKKVKPKINNYNYFE